MTYRKSVNHDALTAEQFAERHLIDKLLSSLAARGYVPVAMELDGEVKPIKDSRTIWPAFRDCNSVMFLHFRRVGKDSLQSWVRLTCGQAHDVIGDWMVNDKLFDRIVKDVCYTGLT